MGIVMEVEKKTWERRIDETDNFKHESETGDCD